MKVMGSMRVAVCVSAMRILLLSSRGFHFIFSLFLYRVCQWKVYPSAVWQRILFHLFLFICSVCKSNAYPSVVYQRISFNLNAVSPFTGRPYSSQCLSLRLSLAETPSVARYRNQILSAVSSSPVVRLVQGRALKSLSFWPRLSA